MSILDLLCKVNAAEHLMWALLKHAPQSNHDGRSCQKKALLNYFPHIKKKKINLCAVPSVNQCVTVTDESDSALSSDL